MVRTGRYAWLFAVAAAALAGCGGSSHHVTTSASAELFAAPFTPPPDAPTLPSATSKPMVCTVYEAGYSNQVIFASDTFDVRAECQAWTRNRSDEGYLWGYQPAQASVAPTESRQVCYVADRWGIVAARVIEATGLRRASAQQAAQASSACSSLLASGWIRLGPARRTGNHR